MSTQTLPLALTEVQQGWLKMAGIKEQLVKDLENAELAIQSYILNLDDLGLVALQEKLRQAKTLAAQAKDQRLQFTRWIDDKLLTPLMQYEKRNEALIKTADAKELELRIAESAKIEEANKLIEEEERFKAHFTNEYFRIAAQYRAELRQLITTYYVKALEKKLPLYKLQQHKQSIQELLQSNVSVESPSKFERKLITTERAKALFASIRPYNADADLQEAKTKILDEVFENYEADIKRPKSAAKEVTAETEKIIEQEKEKLEAEVATNELIASGTTLEAPRAPKIKTLLEPVIEDTEEWAINILSLTIKKWNTVKAYYRVKAIRKLTLEQMAEGLTKMVMETNVSLEGLKTKEVKK